jgi:Tol biopolymer transport system component
MKTGDLAPGRSGLGVRNAEKESRNVIRRAAAAVVVLTLFFLTPGMGSASAKVPGSRTARKRRAVTTAMVAITAWATLFAVPPAEATYAGHNGQVVFGSITTTGRQLFTVAPNDQRLRQITHVEGDASFPDWSPDGRSMVFDVEADDRCSIMLMKADGSDLRDLTQGRPGCEENASFTPDGRSLVFVAQRCEDCTEGIWSMSITGHHRRLITNSPAGMHSKDPNVSPDGTKLSLIAEDEQNLAGIFVMNLAPKGHLREVVPRSYDVSRKHDWSPDSRRILFSDNANELDLPANLETVRPDGSELRHLTHYTDASTRVFAGSFSPNGRWVVARLETASSYSLVRMRTHGGPVHTILSSPDTAQTGSDWGAAPHGCG